MSEGRNNIASTSLLHFVLQSELEVHVESDSSKLTTSTSLQRITSLVSEFLDNVIFQTLSVSEGRGVRKSAKGEQNLTLPCGGDEKVIRTPPAISFSPVNRKLTCSSLPMSLSVLKYSGEFSRSRFIFTDSCCTCTPIQSVVDRFIANNRQPCILQLGGTGTLAMVMVRTLDGQLIVKFGLWLYRWTQNPGELELRKLS